MPNIPLLYTRLTKNPPKEVNVEKTNDINPADDAARQQMESNWKRSTVTLEKANKLTDDIAKLFDECLVIAHSYPQHQNPHKMVQNLVKIKALKEILETYV